MRIGLLMIGLSVLLALPAHGAITDGATALNQCTGDTCAVPITISGANAEAIVTVQWFATTSRTVTTVTLGGGTAVLIDRSEQASCAGGRCGVEKWHLTNPSTGTITAQAWLSAAGAQMVIGVKTYLGVDGTTPLGTPKTTAGNAAAQSLTFTTAAGDVLDGGLVIANAGGTPSPIGATQYYNGYDLAGSIQVAASSMAASAGSTEYKWTYATAQAFALIAVPLKPAGSGGGGGGSATERLVWTDLSNGLRQETNTRVYWKHLTQPTYQLIATLSPDSTSHTVTYTTETDRCYVVDQINTAGTSPLSNELCSDITAPGPIRATLTPASLGGGLSDD